jgi:hypothetical protein
MPVQPTSRSEPALTTVYVISCGQGICGGAVLVGPGFGTVLVGLGFGTVLVGAGTVGSGVDESVLLSLSPQAVIKNANEATAIIAKCRLMVLTLPCKKTLGTMMPECRPARRAAGKKKPPDPRGIRGLGETLTST